MEVCLHEAGVGRETVYVYVRAILLERSFPLI